MYVYVVLEQNNYKNVTRVAAVYTSRGAAESFIETFTTLVHTYKCVQCKLDSINFELD